MIYRYLKLTQIADSILHVSIDRPEKKNALSLAVMEELTFLFEENQNNTPLRVIILSGEGTVFCAGLDLNEAADIALAEKMAQHVARLFKSIYSSSLVTIAAVQGDAIAGGAGIVAACDIALIAKGARMGFPETRRGLIAAQVATLLCRQMRMRDVRELLLMGELVDSQHAQSIGLVNRIVEADKLLAESIFMAEIIIKAAPEALKETKRLISKLDPANFFDDLEIALSFFHSARHSEEAKEGISAFLEKRPPSWSNQ